MSTHSAPALGSLASRLSELSLRDAHRLGRRLEGARKIRKPEARAAVLGEIEAGGRRATERMAARRARVPEVRYPEQLPVSQKKDAIAEAIRDHQVVIVAGETGSGKTTQIPKICMELGRGVRGMIGHTQPRRIAARTVAERVAEELDTPLGEAVGWKVRFTDQVDPEATFIKLMTDGILLAEIQTDRELRAYDTIIIDEAHERSLNIDFLLGYLAQLLPKRPDLKVVITSATIDPERFSRHFGDAPIIEVSGRTYPVEVRYRPLLEENPDDAEDADRDQITAITDAVEELMAEGPGDILVFLSGEREIRDTADALNKKRYRSTEVLPLYARLSHAEQHRVFQQHSGRRIVLATNVAETSLTVPGIKYVIDPGFARISRYSHRTKVQRLPIEPISQASANQRKGRCGRTSDGICIRLYSEDDFLSRPEFTDAEILRTNLASVILQMTAAGLGEIEKFPFIDPPDHRNIRDGVQLLQELGALDAAQKDPRKRLTQTGRKLAQLPVDPRLARMVLEADKNGCVREVMVVAAALSIQDPRERPADKQTQADQQHARFRDETSDFLAFLNLWRYIREQQKERGSSSFRRMCKQEYLNFLRIREWQDIYAQLRTVAKQMGIHLNDQDAPADRIHVSLLAGLLSHIGVKDVKESKDSGQGGGRRDGGRNEYLGARNAKFAIFPGSRAVQEAAAVRDVGGAGGDVPAVGAGQREDRAGVGRAARRAPAQAHLQRAALGEGPGGRDGVREGHALRRADRGAAEGELRADRPGGVPRAVHPQRPGRGRLAHAPQVLRGQPQAADRGRGAGAPGAAQGHPGRRRDPLRLLRPAAPRPCGLGAHFDSWWKHKRREQPDFLDFEREMLIRESADAVTKADYPDSWRQGPLKFRVTYQFEPGADADGVTVHIPLQVLNQVTDEGFDWQIPGLREEVVTELIRSLPKPIRRNYVPAPNYAKAFLERAVPLQEPLTVTMARELKRMVGVPFDADDFDWSRVPDHLKVTFRIVDERRRTLAEDKDLEALKLKLRPKARKALSQAAAATAQRQGGESLERKGLTDWTIGSLTRVFETRRAGQPVKAYPALVDDGDSVSVRLFDSEAEQAEAMWKGTRRLILLGIPVNPAKFASEKLTNPQKLALSANPHGSVQALFDDCAMAAADKLIADFGGPVWDEESYRKLFDKVRAEIVDTTVRAVGQVQQVLAAWQACERRLKGVRSPALLPNLQDVRTQLDGLVKPGFVTEAGAAPAARPDAVPGGRGRTARLQQMPANAQRDTTRMAKVHEMRDEYAWLLEQMPRGDRCRSRCGTSAG